MSSWEEQGINAYGRLRVYEPALIIFIQCS